MSTMTLELRDWWTEEAPSAERQAPWLRAAAPAETDPALDAELERAEEMVRDQIEDDEPAILRPALDRASAFLRVQSRESRERFEKFPPAPYVSPGPDGSVDLHWERPGWGLLINVPADESPATFYGDGGRMCRIKGSFDPRTCDLGIINWLSKM
jgi:hypothetical protein